MFLCGICWLRLYDGGCCANASAGFWTSTEVSLNSLKYEQNRKSFKRSWCGAVLYTLVMPCVDAVAVILTLFECIGLISRLAQWSFKLVYCRRWHAWKNCWFVYLGEICFFFLQEMAILNEPLTEIPTPNLGSEFTFSRPNEVLNLVLFVATREFFAPTHAPLVFSGCWHMLEVILYSLNRRKLFESMRSRESY